MQLKGLVRFFTILLIVFSLYNLSFTWFVNKHEKKMEAKATRYVNSKFPKATDKYPNNKDSQGVYQDFLDKEKEVRLRELLDSTKDVTVTYGITGPVSYKKAKGEELNLGLDLQGGMNVTMEVEMTGLLKSLANNSTDPTFLAAIDNANKAKANSDADFINLFIAEMKKLDPNKQLNNIFSLASAGKVDAKSTNSQVESYLRTSANIAFENTDRILRTRIDKFGVSQPAIYPNPDKKIISVELPGVKDKERVRALLQSTANLQFWETYKPEELQNAFANADRDYEAYLKGESVTTPDTAATTVVDTTGGKKVDTTKDVNANKKSLMALFKQTQGEGIASISLKDTSALMRALRSDIIRRHFPGDAVFAFGIASRAGQKDVGFYVLKTGGSDKAPLEGDAITDASPELDGGRPIVSLRMNDFGASKWGALTEKSNAQQRPIAIVLDNVVFSAPIAQGKLGNSSQITGNFTTETATDLANILKIGKLPAPAKIVQEQQVGPTLGEKAIKSGSMAFIISFIVIFILMLVYYNTSGWVANIALILNLLFTIGILPVLGASLTAAGIAGLVLTIGMAVDTNVIIYERIKEELNKGKGYIPAINEGYKRSLPPVLDGHITVFLTALILFYFGLGPVRGFATTQMLGIALSLFCGILVSRWVTEWFTNKKKHLEYFTGVSKKVFQHAKFKFIEYRKVAYMISLVVLGLGIASFFNGFDYGVEFNGGRSYTVQFEKKMDVDKVRDELKAAFENETPIIKTVETNSRLDITTSYRIKETGTSVDSLVETKLFEGLKPYFPNMTFERFSSQKDKLGVQATKKVLPSISDDLKKGAIKATIFALIAIFIYILIRFRNWRYSLGTVVALLHDVLITLIVFSFLRKVMPFPLEIDQHFIAAVLTVIGFSMNDTVIVFDRIREYNKQMAGAPKGQIINAAINDTLSRTIMTSLTVFLTVLILFLVGGEVTKGFAFAMLVGIITGTYSSIFVAAPILVDLGGDELEKPKKETKA
jgi:SecD/SecF fusion protein